MEKICRQKTADIVVESISSNIVHLIKKNILKTKGHLEYQSKGSSIKNILHVANCEKHLVVTQIENSKKENNNLSLDKISQIFVLKKEDPTCITEFSEKSTIPITELKSFVRKNLPGIQKKAEPPFYSFFTILITSLLGVVYGLYSNSILTQSKMVIIGIIFSFSTMMINKSFPEELYLSFISHIIMAIYIFIYTKLCSSGKN